MIKKVLIIIGVFFAVFCIFNIANASVEDGCKFGNGNTDWRNCVRETKVYQPNIPNTKVEGGFRTLTLDVIYRIAKFLFIIAVGVIAVGAIVIVASNGEEEKIKKGKTIIIWSILGFLGLVSASGIIAIVVDIIYGFD